MSKLHNLLIRGMYPFLSVYCSFIKKGTGNPDLNIRSGLSYSSNATQGSLDLLELNDVIFDPRYNGLYNKNGQLIEGSELLRGNRPGPFNAPQEIQLPSDFSIIDAAVYGGIFFGYHYGHFLTETLSRLWVYLPKRIVPDVPLLFRHAQEREECAQYASDVFNALGLRDQLVFPKEIVLIKKCFIPGSAQQNNLATHSAYIDLSTQIGTRLTENMRKHTEKTLIYLSRSQLSPLKRKILNEQRLQGELEQLGFQIVYPEQLSLREQVQIFKTAHMIVAPIGSAFHTLPLAGKTPAHIIYLTQGGHLDNSTFVNIDRSLDLNSWFIDSLVPFNGSLKKGYGQDQLVDTEGTIAHIRRLLAAEKN